jgi:hypothetical protein
MTQVLTNPINNIQVGDVPSSAFEPFRGRMSREPVYRPPERQRILLSGWPGAGKSSWVLSIPRCWVLDFDTRGTEELGAVHKTSLRTSIETWEDAEKALKALEDDAKGGRPAFDMVALDTADMMAGNACSIAAVYLARRLNMSSFSALGVAGWNGLIELASQFMVRLTALGYGWVATCHLRRKLVDVGGSNRHVVMRDLTDRVDGILRGMAAYCLELSKAVMEETVRDTIKVGGREMQAGARTVSRTRYLLTMKSTDPALEEQLKCRVPMPAVIEWTPADGWQKWAEAYQESIRKLKENRHGE